MRPWKPTRRDLEREGHWADFVAWERWFNRQDVDRNFEYIETGDRCFLYGIFCKAADHGEKQ